MFAISRRIRSFSRPKRLNPLDGAVPQRTYVAFADILGFSQLVESDFEAARDLYQGLIGNRDMVTHMRNGSVTLRIFSDSILITSTNLAQILGAVQTLNFVTLMNNFLIRGGIAVGHHLERGSDANLFIVSEPLVKTARLEKSIKMPCIAIDASVDIPDEWWLCTSNVFQRPILFYDGIQLVNPFNVAWGQSAWHRVKLMRDKYPEHRDKYDWLIQLYEAVIAGARLVPPRFSDTGRVAV